MTPVNWVNLERLDNVGGKFLQDYSTGNQDTGRPKYQFRERLGHLRSVLRAVLDPRKGLLEEVRTLFKMWTLNIHSGLRHLTGQIPNAVGNLGSD